MSGVSEESVVDRQARIIERIKACWKVDMIDAREARDEIAAMRAGVREQISHLDLLIRQMREQGDVRQVLLEDSGVSEAPTLADELGIITLGIAAAIAAGSES